MPQDSLAKFNLRQAGLQQIEVAQMLGRHKSWVNRRLALIERLCEEAREALRLGLITPTRSVARKQHSAANAVRT